MAKIVYAWELGTGLGHVSVAAPVLAALAARGHTIVGLLRDLSTATPTLEAVAVRFFQSARRLKPPRHSIQPPRTFADVLNNTAFGCVEASLPVVKSWKWTMEDLKPDLIVFDHCPSGLLATREMDIRRVVFGTGFTCPPAIYPLPDWRPQLPQVAAELECYEQRVLDVANEILCAIDCTPLVRLTDLYADVDATILTTYAELDHFGARTGATYYGAWPTEWRDEPVWPDVPGKRVFAYLKNSHSMTIAVAALLAAKQPTLVFCPDLPASAAASLQSESLRFVPAPLRMSAVVAGCDFAILNGTHTSLIQMLRGGKPLISLPLFLEQQLAGERVAQMRAGLCISEPTSALVRSAIERLTYDSLSFDGALHFAAKYREERQSDAIRRIAEALDDLLTTASR